MKYLPFLFAFVISFSDWAQKPKMRLLQDSKLKIQVEQQIVEQWSAYSKAFEYSDYKTIAAHFTYPTTIDLIGSPLVINDASELMAWYKKGRTSIQQGYKYSLLEKSRIMWLSKELILLDATYGRFNADYQRIHRGRGIYMYKKTPLGWKMFSITTLPTPVGKK